MKAVSNKIFCFNFKKPNFKFKIHFKYSKTFQGKNPAKFWEANNIVL